MMKDELHRLKYAHALIIREFVDVVDDVFFKAFNNIILDSAIRVNGSPLVPNDEKLLPLVAL